MPSRSSCAFVLASSILLACSGEGDGGPRPGGGRVIDASGETWVTGYYAGWFWDWSYPPDQVEMDSMTHFVFGRVAPGGGSIGGSPGAVVPAAGTAHQAGLAPDGVRSVEDYLVARAHASGTKALLMLGGDGADGVGFLRSTTNATRDDFVDAIVDYLVAHDYDGVDVDWENELEGNDELGVSGDEAKRRLLALLDELRVEADARPRFQAPHDPVLITHPGYAVSINFLEPGGRVEPWRVEVANRVDQYNLMSYGIGTAYSGGGWGSWFSSPIGGASGTTPYDLETSLAAYVASGVPRAKLGIGIGFYGIYYGPSITGPRQPTDDEPIFETNDVALSYANLVADGYLDHGTEHWDPVAQVNYRSYPAPGFVPSTEPARNPAGFLSFETPASIAAKGAWVRDTGVGGAIVWTIGYGYLPDSQTNPLLDAVREAFLEPH